jgi:AraC-like DNA-binding protein
MFGDNYITVDHPNVSPASRPDVPFGEKVTIFSGKESVVNSDPLYSDVELNDIYMPQVTIRTMEGSFNQNALFFNQHNEGTHMVASCFFMDGQVTTKWRGTDDGVVLRKGYQSLKYDPHNELSHWCAKNKPFSIAHLSVEPDFLFNILPDDEKWAVSLKERIMKSELVFGELPLAISAAQHQALQNIINCPLKGKSGILLIETSIIQLMLLLVQGQFMNEASAQDKISKRDRELIESVRDYVTQTFLDEHSISELARQFGTNTNKLMTQFKKNFGVSIFEYISDLKMDYAKRLLLDEGCFVSDVSRRVGYKNPHHFSVAFKRKHGVCPSTLRNS